MNIYRLLRVCAAFWALAAVCPQLGASIVYLKNGDRVTGSILGREGDELVLNTSMGTLRVPVGNISRTIEGDGPLPENSLAYAMPAEGAPAAPEPAVEEGKVPPDPYADLPEWLREYKYFWANNVPEGWKFWLRGGMEYRSTTSESWTYTLRFAGQKEWDDKNRFRFNAYYDYTREKSVAGAESTTTDKYGFETALRRDLTSHFRDPFHTGGKYTWFLENLASYKKDMVKNIHHQVDEALTIGTEFEFPEQGLKFSIAPGPAVRYISAEDYPHHWVFMGVISEEITWDFHELMRLEQRGYLGLNMTNWNQASAYLMLGFVIKATDVMNIALRYTYNYDSVNSSTNITTEERFILSFEFPLY